MRVRRALAVAAATAVVAPLTLLSAPMAFAEDPIPSASQTQPVGGTPETGGAATTEPAAGGEATGGEAPAESGDTAPADAGTLDAPAAPGQDGLSGAVEDLAAGEEPAQDYPTCEKRGIDKGLSTKIAGLSPTYVAGSGWEEFRYTVTNRTGKELDRLWYDVSVELGAAEVEYLDEGVWVDAFRWEGDTASFGRFADDVAAGETLTSDLRVRVRAGVQSDESFVVGGALYQGEDATCFHNGATYEFVVLPAGTGTPSPTHSPSASPDVTPSPSGQGASPSPQGSGTPATGNLAATGSDAALGLVGAVGAAAVVLGGGAVLLVRRRNAGTRA
jgi:LPXTG-motif cell wall-anchored protein